MNEAKRRRAAMKAADAAGLQGLLVTHPADVRYLSGFTGSSAALAMVEGKTVLFTDGRYTAQAKEETKGLKVVVEQKPPVTLAAEWFVAAGVSGVGFDSGQMTVSAVEKFRKIPPRSVRRGFFVGVEGLVARLREVKDADEIARMKKAADLGCELFDGLLEHIVAGATEVEVAAELEFAARRAGAEAMSFETIVAGGLRSALPHGKASQAKLPKKGFVTLDFGVVLDGYCSDMTRTVRMGKSSYREWDVYHSVLEAQQAAVAMVRAGVTCGEVDEAARSVLREAKLDQYFSHSTGHGVGLEIHENPRVASKQKQVLEPGMVITIEPGVYIAGEFGIRIEDMVLVTKSGAEVLTTASPKVWIEL